MKWSLLLLGLVAIAGTAAACDGLSPGDQVRTEDGICTLGFLVADRNGLYFTTAGHCIDVDELASNPDVGEFGVGVFHHLEPETGSQTDGSPGDDFALIRVHESLHASLNPKMCAWEGPTGIYNDTPGGGFLRLYGHSMVFGDLGAMGAPTYAREAVLMRNTEDAFYFIGPSLMGDSGSAVLHEDGRAMGVLTHLLIGGTSTNGGTGLERGFRLAAEAGFPDLRLVLMGEDPVAVLASLRAPPPAAAEPGTPPPAGSPPPSSAPPPSTPPKEAPRSNGTSANDSAIQPAAAVDHSLAPEKRQDSPFLAAPLVALALVAALVLARRR